MMFKAIHTLNDKKVNCYSILTEVKMGDYYNFVKRIYQNDGGIENQRPPLTTKSAKIIRARMVDDLKEGSVIPPIVLGVVVDDEEYDMIDMLNQENVGAIVSGIIGNGHHISIIDGMQRTTAIAELLSQQNLFANFSDSKLRIEFWLAKSVRSLIYRMLVLNTGQIPWRLDRQIKVLYSDVAKEVNKALFGTIKLLKDGEQRVAPGEYPDADVLSLFIVFGANQLDTDTQEEIAEEFKRLDFVKSTTENNFTVIFSKILSFMIQLDEQFARVEGRHYGEEMALKRFKNGVEIFGSQPARVGFVFAFTEYIMGLNGAEHSHNEKEEFLGKSEVIMDSLVAKMKGLGVSELADFVDLPQLSEVVNNPKRSAKVGKFERELFYRVFKKMLVEHALHSFTPYWRAQ